MRTLVKTITKASKRKQPDSNNVGKECNRYIVIETSLHDNVRTDH